MLEIDRRALLVDALKPPPGMTLDRAVGTTFTLDLDALLIAPVAFALFDLDLGEYGLSADPISLFEAIRRHADRIDLFCQAGEIAVPSTYQPILSQLEDSIHPVTAPKGGIFHPKVWVIRYLEPGSGATYHRLLCMSRNLTFNRSWDLIVRLEERPEGKPTETTGAASDLLAALPGMAVRELPADRRAGIRDLAASVGDVEFARPDRVRSLALHAFGLDAGTRPDPIGRPHHVLIASPFVGDRRLLEMTDGVKDATLISRQESLDRLQLETLERFDDRVYTLDPAAHGSESHEQETSSHEGAGERTGLSGLHAKLVIAQTGARASVFVGSANATEAAASSNVEFVAELQGHTRDLGIDAFLESRQGNASFFNLLVPYGRMEVPKDSAEAERAEAAVHAVGWKIAGVPFTAQADSEGDDLYRLRLTSRRKLPAGGGATVAWWPITLGRGHAITSNLGERLDLDFGRVSLRSVTSFFAFEVSRQHAGGTASATFVVNAALRGAPEDRRLQVLSEILRSRRDVLRYLLLLLSDFADPNIAGTIGGEPKDGPGGGHPDAFELPLFESLVRTLGRSPQRLDHVARLIDDLRARPEAADLLPEGFDAVWEPIRKARERL